MPVTDGRPIAKIYFGSTKPVTIGKARKGNTNHQLGIQFPVHHAIVSAVKSTEFVSGGFHI